MATLEDLKKAADVCKTYPRDSTPMFREGEFGATAMLFGILRVFAFRGELDDPNAVIMRRFESPKERGWNGYEGDGLFGGRLMTFSAEHGWR